MHFALLWQKRRLTRKLAWAPVPKWELTRPLPGPDEPDSPVPAIRPELIDPVISITDPYVVADVEASGMRGDQHGSHFDSAQMPLNALDAHFRSFEKNVLPKLIARNRAVLGMKPLAEGEIPRSGVVSAIDALHYAISLPTTTVITGCDTMERLNQALEAARSLRPLSAEQMVGLRDKTRQVAVTGKLELFESRTSSAPPKTRSGWLGQWLHHQVFEPHNAAFIVLLQG